MKANLRVFLQMMTICGLSACATNPVSLMDQPPEITAQSVHVDRYPEHSVTFANGVTGFPSLIYAMPMSYRPLNLDLYLPPLSANRPPQGYPFIVHIHGGDWAFGSSRNEGPFFNFPELLASLSEKGYVVASVNYRLSGEAPFPAPIQDVKAAIRFLRANSSKYSIDPTRAIAWGSSAGGHLAALAAVSCNVKALEPTAENVPFQDIQADVRGPTHISDCVQGAVAWYGVFDLTTLTQQAQQEQTPSRMSSQASAWQMLGCAPQNCKTKQKIAASPVTYIDPKDPPMLLIVGDQDKTVPSQQTLEMGRRLKAAGVPSKVIVLPGVDHALIGKELGQTRKANLKALTATFDFFDRTIGSKSSKENHVTVNPSSSSAPALSSSSQP